ncbi:phospholipase D family protein [Aestuariibacter salexigens]|uniref:phospholipase D family protein n=1 Tax=Aestuariibacter salexigens TaxID=226010 RepID=UPI000429C93B|nr:phospholipase D family protein [Aestuariibacter salexigens]
MTILNPLASGTFSANLIENLTADVNSVDKKLSGVMPLSTELDAFLARLALIDSAKESIDLQYYIYHGDLTGHALTWALVNAAKRGVKVRLLLDDMNTSRNDEGMSALDQHINIEVRLFNPFAFRYFRGLQLMHDFRRINRRMHNKSMTVDGKVTVVGGRNIGDEYFGANETLSFGDFDLLTVGNVVAVVQHQFDIYWDSDQVYPVSTFIKHNFSIQQLNQNQMKLRDAYMQLMESNYSFNMAGASILQTFSLPSPPFYWAQSYVMYDAPKKIRSFDTAPDEFMINALFPYLKNIERSLVLVSPYFVPGKVGADYLLSLVKKGIEVTVITNSLAATDVVAVHGGYRRYRRRLVKGGISLFEVKVNTDNKPSHWKGLRRATLHAKTFCADQRYIFVGSFNLDPRSAHLNTELGILVDSEALANDVVGNMHDSLKRNSYRLALNAAQHIIWHDDLYNTSTTTEPDTSLWRRIGAVIMGWLPIERHL